MKKLTSLLLLLFFGTLSRGQDQLVKDLDGDGRHDTVSVDREASRLVCRLSTLSFTPLHSKAIEILNESAGVKATKSGFQFFNNWMRAGYASQFRYDVKTKRLQLIGLSRYELGNAANDGSGESSVNLLTSDYIGHWNYFDYSKEELVKLPTIKTKMPLGTVYLENFSDETYFAFAEKCAALYEKQKGIKSRAHSPRP